MRPWAIMRTLIVLALLLAAGTPASAMDRRTCLVTCAPSTARCVEMGGGRRLCTKLWVRFCMASRGVACLSEEPPTTTSRATTSSSTSSTTTTLPPHVGGWYQGAVTLHGDGKDCGDTDQVVDGLFAYISGRADDYVVLICHPGRDTEYGPTDWIEVYHVAGCADGSWDMTSVRDSVPFASVSLTADRFRVFQDVDCNISYDFTRIPALPGDVGCFY